MRILHLPRNVAGAASGLVAAERALGHDSKTLSISPSRRGFPADIERNVYANGVVNRVVSSLKLVNEVRATYDILHFYFGSSLLHYPRIGLHHLDLPFYSANTKKVFTYQGCDARQKYPTMLRNNEVGNEFAACFDENCYDGACNSGRRDLQRRRAIDKVAKHADYIFAVNPDLLFFLPREKSIFLPYVIHGYHDLSPKRTPFVQNDVFHIVHAPTNRAAKGTKHLLRAIDRIQDRFGSRVKFTLIENLDVHDARIAYKDADVIVDQLLVGWYGGLSVEAMRLGIPVVCYINPMHLAMVPEKMAEDMPIIQADPKTIEQVLIDLINNRDRLPELAKAGLQFCQRWHDPEKVSLFVLEKTLSN